MADLGDDFDDLDALLDAPIQKASQRDEDEHNCKNGDSRNEKSGRGEEDGGHHRRRGDKENRHSRRRSRSHERERGGGDESSSIRDHRSSRRRSGSRERARSRSPTSHSRHRRRKSRSRSPPSSSHFRRRHSRSPRRHNHRSRSGDRRSRSRERRRSSKSPSDSGKAPESAASVEERDARTVFIMQLSQRVRVRDVEEFFSTIGKIRDIKMIICNRTRRFKGIAYVEFDKIESVPLAMGLNGQKLLGIPIIVQPSQAEKNRMVSSNVPVQNTFPNKPRHGGPSRLYIGSLHYHITEEMIRSIFEPFGAIQTLQLIMEPGTNRSRGYGFITYHNVEDACKAAEQMNGFELAGRPIKVSQVTDKATLNQQHQMGGATAGLAANEDNIPFDANAMSSGQPATGAAAQHSSGGYEFGMSDRLALMSKLAAGTDMQVPQVNTAESQSQKLASLDPPVATPCFQLSSMFGPRDESKSNIQWDVEMAEIRDDVVEECSKYGSVVHVHVDKTSQNGLVYVKCVNVPTALASVNALHGRWFSGSVITAAYIPLVNYHNLFPDAVSAITPLKTVR